MGNIFHDGFFGTNDPAEDSFITKVIIYFIYSLSIILQCVIALSAMTKLRGNKDTVMSVNLVFIVTVLSASAHSVCGFVARSDWYRHRHYRYDVVFFMMLITTGVFYWCLLVTFILRLYITFKVSAYSMSTALIAIFMLINMLGVVGWILCSLLFVFFACDLSIAYAVALTLFGLYVFGCGLAVYFFVSNLSKVAKAREISLRDCNLTPTTVRLDHNQRQMAHLSAKYMMLFGGAMASTFLGWILGLSVSYWSGFRGAVISIDLTVNLWCIYLQYSFAKNQYKRCCGWCDTQCKNYRLKQTKALIHRHSVDLAKHRTTLETPKIAEDIPIPNVQSTEIQSNVVV